MAKKHLLTSIVSVFLLSGILQVLIAQESRFPQMTLPEKLLASLKSGHPRLHATKADFEALKGRITTDETLKKWYDAVKTSGDRILGEEPSIYIIPDGLRLLSTSRRVVNRMFTLGFLYQMEGDKKYAERAWKELEAVSKFPDWNPKHFLDVGEMTNAFGIAYDWMYDYWNTDQKNIIKSAIIEKGLCRAMMAYEGVAVQNHSWWIRSEHNWNQVCHGGIGIGALAIADEDPKLAEYILRNVIKFLPYAMVHFGPDGAWNEGPGYWGYATQYNIYILSGLETALGTDFGLSNIEGFSKTVLFPMYLTGPFNRSFNYADGGDGPTGGSQLYWLAAKYNAPLAAKYQLQLTRSGSPLDLLWYSKELADRQAQLPPLAAYYRASEVATMRGAWDDRNTWFVGFKAGDNNANHSNLDLGSFVLDAYGKRFIMDLGADNYNAPGYFSTGANGPRWNYYRMRAEGHNTLVINPGTKADQDPLAFAGIKKFNSKGNTAFAVADLTPAYAAEAKSVQRGIALAGGNTVVIRDEVTTGKPSQLYWFLHTRAELKLAGNAKRATLTIDSAQVVAEIVSPANAKFTIMNAEPLATSPKAENNKNEGIRKLAISLAGIANTNIVVVVRPVKGRASAAAAFLKPLSSW
ncbi:MAG TPA: heparinase II/III family protein [Bacteroidales bacterium]|nr:heparinase II/III family protein [Bacteroidales bacterium]HQM69102.1 heparinase II/III family protein [Bacteroidales bacterium]